MSAEHNNELITCELCGRKLKSITNSHLREKHKMTTAEYKTMFPDSSMIGFHHNEKLAIWRKSEANKLHLDKQSVIMRYDERRLNGMRKTFKTEEYRTAQSLRMKEVVKDMPNGVMYQIRSGSAHHHYGLSNYQRWINKDGIEVANIKLQNWKDNCKIPGKSKNTSGEVLLKTILEKNNITYIHQYNKISIYYVDFYLPDYNLVIEVQGDYWHCSPLKHKSTDYVNFPGRPNTRVSDVWDADKKRFMKIESLGYNIVGLFSHELNENTILEVLKRFMKI